MTVQFGYHTDTYMYCKYLDRSKYNISYFCFDMFQPKYILPDLNIIYIQHHTNKILRYLIFIREFTQHVRKNKYDFIFHVHTKYTFLIRLLNLFQPIVLDIRTGDLSDIKIIRFLKNNEIKLLTFMYRHVSVISESLAIKLAIFERKTIILPLGGELHDIPAKNFDSLKLLYVGTLDNRNIQDTVYGLSAYLKQHPSEKISYDIIGSGNNHWLSLLNKAITETNLQSLVIFHSWKNHSELVPFFEMNNIGVVYIPQRDYYEFQPSTKLYESLLAGMPVVATNTYENKIALKQECGVLTDDNPVSFCYALEQINANRHLYDSDTIKKLYNDFRWDSIVKNKLETYIDNCCE